MNNRRYALIGLIFLVMITSITTSISLGYLNIFPELRISGYTKEDWEFFEKFLAYKAVLNNTYYENIDNDKLYEWALYGMVYSVGDKYTTYLGESENKEFNEAIESRYEGVGIWVTNFYGNKILIHEVIEGGPAEKADLRVGDIITKVNGKEYSGEQLNEAVKEMKDSPVGSKIELTLIRDDTEIVKEIVIEEVQIKHLSYENKSGIGYIKIEKFSEGVSELFEEAYEDLTKQQVKDLIIDLRDNGGGFYDEVLEIAKKIVPKGLIVYTEDKDKKQEKEFSESEGINMNLVVLVNNNSASASEVLAGAIKDRKCGTLVGETTYGKGLVQGVFEMNDGTAMKVTIAKYYTPSGVCIDGKGIEPDILIEDDAKTAKDEQLEKALEILKK